MHTGAYTHPSLGLNGYFPPLVVHSHQAEARKKTSNNTLLDDENKYTKDEKIYLDPRFCLGLSDPAAGPKSFYEEKNPCGFCVHATKNGSMTHNSFFDFCAHFVKWKKSTRSRGLTTYTLP